MIKVRLKISSVNDTTYKQVVLRKFFNMVFFSADGKKTYNLYGNSFWWDA